MSLAEGREDSPRDHKAERAPPCGLFSISSQPVRVVQNHKARSPILWLHVMCRTAISQRPSAESAACSRMEATHSLRVNGVA